MCELCNDESSSYEVFYNDILGEYYLDVETMQWDDYDDGFLHIKINISYCPYCGRKLDDKRRK